MGSTKFWAALLGALFFHAVCFGQRIDTLYDWPLLDAGRGEPIVIAVVDDGFTRHDDILPFLYQNKRENPINSQDDDDNGYIDDYAGYDVADGDNDAMVPSSRLVDAYHGTAVSGVICQALRSMYGADAHEHFQILPIKAIPDNTDRYIVSSGYAGIAYATAMKVDLMVCAWSGGTASADNRAIVKKAIQQGIPVIAAAGNAYGNPIQSPADIEGVITVAGIGASDQRIDMSSYGPAVDISARADECMVPSSTDREGYRAFANTSLATPLVAAVAAAILAENEGVSPRKLLDIIQSSARPIDTKNPYQAGRLGAGALDPIAALTADSRHNPLHPEGMISLETAPQWIKPEGVYSTTHLSLIDMQPWDADKLINIHQDETDSITYIAVSDLLGGFDLSGSGYAVSADLDDDQSIVIGYESTVLDSSVLYCSEVVEIAGDSGYIDDGSGDKPYGRLSSCKWHITSAPGTGIKITIEQIDTQAKVDHIYVFNGDAPRQTDMLARFSGKRLPPVIYSTTNEVLIWFVTDGDTHGDGWRLRYEAFTPGSD